MKKYFIKPNYIKLFKKNNKLLQKYNATLLNIGKPNKIAVFKVTNNDHVIHSTIHIQFTKVQYENIIIFVVNSITKDNIDYLMPNHFKNKSNSLLLYFYDETLLKWSKISENGDINYNKMFIYSINYMNINDNCRYILFYNGNEVKKQIFMLYNISKNKWINIKNRVLSHLI